MSWTREDEIRKETRGQILHHLTEAAKGCSELLMKEVWGDCVDQEELDISDNELDAMVKIVESGLIPEEVGLEPPHLLLCPVCGGELAGELGKTGERFIATCRNRCRFAFQIPVRRDPVQSRG